MNEEEKTITTNEPAAEKQTKPAKPKRTDEEKLQECYEKRVTCYNKVVTPTPKVI